MPVGVVLDDLLSFARRRYSCAGSWDSGGLNPTVRNHVFRAANGVPHRILFRKTDTGPDWFVRMCILRWPPSDELSLVPVRGYGDTITRDHTTLMSAIQAKTPPLALSNLLRSIQKPPIASWFTYYTTR